MNERDRIDPAYTGGLLEDAEVFSSLVCQNLSRWHNELRNLEDNFGLILRDLCRVRLRYEGTVGTFAAQRSSSGLCMLDEFSETVHG